MIGFSESSRNSGYGLPRARFLLGRVIGFRIKKDDLAAGEFELKGNTDEIVQLFANSCLRFWRGKEQHEAAAACSEEFSAERAGGQSTFINLIDMGVGDLGTQIAFREPCLMQKLSKRLNGLVAIEHGNTLVDKVLEYSKLPFFTVHVVHVAFGDR